MTLHKTRWPISVTVDVDPHEIEDAGYHHEDDCPAKTGSQVKPAEIRAARLESALDELHQQAHSRWPIQTCTQEPCRSLVADSHIRTGPPAPHFAMPTGAAS